MKQDKLTLDQIKFINDHVDFEKDVQLEMLENVYLKQLKTHIQITTATLYNIVVVVIFLSKEIMHYQLNKEDCFNSSFNPPLII